VRGDRLARSRCGAPAYCPHAHRLAANLVADNVMTQELTGERDARGNYRPMAPPMHPEGKQDRADGSEEVAVANIDLDAEGPPLKEHYRGFIFELRVSHGKEGEYIAQAEIVAGAGVGSGDSGRWIPEILTG
jgi:hypothetical protein